ncbi:MAG TPA: Smr/MutS family protein [Candidatus Faecimonas gallistercoris]|nr:Smr/MutS family protein [Candidatus Faecimonas gallistercoris]
MMNLYNQYPVLDLHGFDRDYARIMIEDFIYDCYRMKSRKAIIIHGIGSGVLRKTTQEVLNKSRYVEEAKLDIFNAGETIVVLKDC